MDFSLFQWLIQSNQFVSNCILLYHLKLECSGFELFHLKQTLEFKTDVREKKAKTIFYVNMQEIWFWVHESYRITLETSHSCGENAV